MSDLVLTGHGIREPILTEEEQRLLQRINYNVRQQMAAAVCAGVGLGYAVSGMLLRIRKMPRAVTGDVRRLLRLAVQANYRAGQRAMQTPHTRQSQLILLTLTQLTNIAGSTPVPPRAHRGGRQSSSRPPRRAQHARRGDADRACCR